MSSHLLSFRSTFSSREVESSECVCFICLRVWCVFCASAVASGTCNECLTPHLSPTVIHSEPELLDHRQVPADSVQAVHVQTCGRGKELWVKKKFCTPCLYIMAPRASCRTSAEPSLVTVVTKNVAKRSKLVIFLLNEKICQDVMRLLGHRA